MEGTVYIFHGLFDRSEFMNISPLKLVLSNMGYEVKVPEFIGHGKRKNDGEVFMVKDTMDELDEMISSEEGDVILIGHSMGGAMAISLGIMNPSVKKIYGISAPNGRFMAGRESNIKILKFFGKKPTDVTKKQYRQILRVMPMVYGECEINKQKRFYLIHCKSDEVVPIEEFEENVEMLCVNKRQTMVIDKITGNGMFDHSALFNDFRTLNFIKETIKGANK
jgi:esterase/lipase